MIVWEPTSTLTWEEQNNTTTKHMGTRVKVTYVALNKYGKPITSASTFDDLRKALDEYYAVDGTDAQCLGFVPYETKYPDDYEGYYTYSWTSIIHNEKTTELDVIKVYCIEYYPHTVYEV